MNKDFSFPAFYISTDKISIKSKKIYETVFLINLVLLVMASLLGTIKIDDRFIGLFIKISGFIYFICSILMFILLFVKFEKKWYTSRAITESLKSLTWKYMIGGEPFSLTLIQNDVDNSFIQILKELNNEVKSKSIFKDGNVKIGEQITIDMLNVRKMTLQERRTFYSENRINNQLDWYKNKAKYNGRMSKIYFSIITILLFITFIYLVFLNPADIPIKITSLIASITSSLLAWLQVKKHQELSEAYTLTAQDINLIKEKSKNIVDENSLSIFVSDAETAFSREHTMWLARRDSFDYQKI
jgi:hypothetical protein